MTNPLEDYARYYDPEPEPDGEAVCGTCNGEGRWCPNPECDEGVVPVWIEDYEEAWDPNEIDDDPRTQRREA